MADLQEGKRSSLPNTTRQTMFPSEVPSPREKPLSVYDIYDIFLEATRKRGEECCRTSE